MKIYKSSFEQSIIKNPHVIFSAKNFKEREKFYLDYNKLGFEGIVNKYLETDKRKLTFLSFLYRVKRKIIRKLLNKL